MRTCLILLLIVACTQFALADEFSVSGSVTDEAAEAVPGLSVTVDGAAVDVDAQGNFVFRLSRRNSKPALIRVSADGFFPALQTVHRSDFPAGLDARMPTIQLTRKTPDRRLLVFAGDTMLTRRYMNPRADEPVLVDRDNPLPYAKALLQHVKPYLELADFASVNLETPLSSEPLQNPLQKLVTFYSPPALADALQWAGVDYVALGNNHIFDFRDAGMRTTFATLERLGLQYSGAGYDDESAREPAYLRINDSEYAFLSYVGWRGSFVPNQVAEDEKGGAAYGDEAIIASDVARVPRGVASVVQLHGGLEYAAQPSLSERTTFYRAIESGADIVIGHHPHVLQGFDIVDGRLIAYSLGNFLFDQYIYSTQLGALLYVYMDGETLHRAEIVPMHVNGYVPTPATGEVRYAILNRVARLSDSVCRRANGFHIVLLPCRADEVAAPPQRVAVGSARPLVLLRNEGISPLFPIILDNAASTYRLGIDMLNRGEFEHVGLFGTHDRTWIENEQVRVSPDHDRRMTVSIAAGDGKASGGLKVFDRVFTPSNPATVAGRIHVTGDVRLRFYLQRRRIEQSFSDGLDNGPLTQIGSAAFDSDGWHTFSFDYNQPRLLTRGIRLLFTLEDLDGGGARAEIDDLVWVEWGTPWQRPTGHSEPAYATHIQFRSNALAN